MREMSFYPYVFIISGIFHSFTQTWFLSDIIFLQLQELPLTFTVMQVFQQRNLSAFFCSPKHFASLFLLCFFATFIEFWIDYFSFSALKAQLSSSFWWEVNCCGLNCVPPKFICCSSNLHYLRMWLYLKIKLKSGHWGGL